MIYGCTRATHPTLYRLQASTQCVKNGERETEQRVHLTANLRDGRRARGAGCAIHAVPCVRRTSHTESITRFETKTSWLSVMTCDVFRIFSALGERGVLSPFGVRRHGRALSPFIHVHLPAHCSFFLLLALRSLAPSGRAPMAAPAVRCEPSRAGSTPR